MPVVRGNAAPRRSRCTGVCIPTISNIAYCQCENWISLLEIPRMLEMCRNSWPISHETLACQWRESPSQTKIWRQVQLVNYLVILRRSSSRSRFSSQKSELMPTQGTALEKALWSNAIDSSTSTPDYLHLLCEKAASRPIPYSYPHIFVYALFIHLSCCFMRCSPCVLHIRNISILIRREPVVEYLRKSRQLRGLLLKFFRLVFVHIAILIAIGSKILVQIFHACIQILIRFVFSFVFCERSSHSSLLRGIVCIFLYFMVNTY